MGELRSGKTFYYRLSEPIFHTLIIRSEILVFHEITQGPFLREQTEFAEWAPEVYDPEWMEQLKNSIEGRYLPTNYNNNPPTH